MFTKSQIDRLGERLKAGAISDDDLRMLDEYRKTFEEPFERVIGYLGEKLGLSASSRLAKSTASIVDKLRRESIRLSQIQDIAGCRIVIHSAYQDSIVSTLRASLPTATVIDRRVKPNFGYRAVHLIVRAPELPIEVQIRTTLQHLWAELSESYSDRFDPMIKYGGGDMEYQEVLQGLSRQIYELESKLHWLSTIPVNSAAPEHVKRTEEVSGIAGRLGAAIFDAYLKLVPSGDDK